MKHDKKATDEKQQRIGESNNILHEIVKFGNEKNYKVKIESLKKFMKKQGDIGDEIVDVIIRTQESNNSTSPSTDITQEKDEEVNKTKDK